MARYANAFGPHAPEVTFVAHEYDEQRFDTGDVEINYVTTGDTSRPRSCSSRADRIVVGLREGARSVG
jgi:hypothetical protein